MVQSLFMQSCDVTWSYDTSLTCIYVRTPLLKLFDWQVVVVFRAMADGELMHLLYTYFKMQIVIDYDLIYKIILSWEAVVTSRRFPMIILAFESDFHYNRI